MQPPARCATQRSQAAANLILIENTYDGSLRAYCCIQRWIISQAQVVTKPNNDRLCHAVFRISH
jgi:hypothetical protein